MQSRTAIGHVPSGLKKGGQMRLTKEIMNGGLGIFDKHFPDEKNTPLKDKKKIVKFFFKLNAYCTKHNMKLTAKHFKILREVK